MGCSLCDIKAQLIKDNQAKGNIIESKEKIHEMSVRIYNQMKLLEEPKQNPKTDKEKEKSKCVSDLMASGKSEAEAKASCGTVGKKDNSVKKETSLTITAPKMNKTLLEFKETYEKLLKLQLTPILNYQDIKRIEQEEYSLKDKLWELEHKYKRSGNSNYPEEDLTIVKIQVQKDHLQ